MTCNCKNKCNKPLRQYKEDVMKELKNRLDKCFIGSEEIQRTVENSYWEMIKDMLNIKTDKSPTDEEYTVHLKSNGKKTKASLYHNGKHVCSAKATAHKEDEQDFNVGASLALKRLLEKATLLDDIEDIEKDIEYKKQNTEKEIVEEAKTILSDIRKELVEKLEKINYTYKTSMSLGHLFYLEVLKIKEGMVYFKDNTFRPTRLSDLDVDLLCRLLSVIVEENNYDKNQKA